MKTNIKLTKENAQTVAHRIRTMFNNWTMFSSQSIYPHAIWKNKMGIRVWDKTDDEWYNNMFGVGKNIEKSNKYYHNTKNVVVLVTNDSIVLYMKDDKDHCGYRLDFNRNYKITPNLIKYTENSFNGECIQTIKEEPKHSIESNYALQYRDFDILY